MTRRRWRGPARVMVVTAAAAAVLAAGLPADEPTAAATSPGGVLDTDGLSLDDVYASLLAASDEEPDERRQAELDDAWGDERPDVDDEDAIPVERVRPKRVADVVDLPDPVRSPRAGQPVVWPEPGRAEVVLPEQARAGDRGRGQGRGAQAGSLPVWVGAPEAADRPGRSAAAAGTAVAVEMLDRSRAVGHGAAIALLLDSADVEVDAGDGAVGGDGRLHRVRARVRRRFRLAAARGDC